jgi:hypothetical protein
MIELEELRKLIAEMTMTSLESSVVFSELKRRGYWFFPPRGNDTYTWNNASKIIKELVKYKCEICGCTKKEYDNNIIVHHKNPLNGLPYDRTLFNNPSNLQVVCRSCHAKIHRKLSNKFIYVTIPPKIIDSTGRSNQTCKNCDYWVGKTNTSKCKIDNSVPESSWVHWDTKCNYWHPIGWIKPKLNYKNKSTTINLFPS